jgi:hypothetical protein
MSLETENFKSIINKLSGFHAFIIILVMIVMSVGWTYYKEYKFEKAKLKMFSDVSVQLSVVSTQLLIMNYNAEIERRGYINLLSEEVAVDYISAILDVSRGKIVAKIMIILDENNINDANREKRIRSDLKKTVLNLYKKDKLLLDKVFYNGASISQVWSNIYPFIVIENIEHILFDGEYGDGNHIGMRKDLVNKLKIDFNGYKSIAILKLKTISIENDINEKLIAEIDK